MTGPLIQLIAWTTMQVYSTVMLMFRKPSIEVPGAHERYVRAECDFYRIANNANTTSYRIAQILTASYVHAPLCPLPAELPFLVPRLTWECLAVVYRQVRMMRAERQIVEDRPDAANVMDMGPVYRELREEAEVEAEMENDDGLIAENAGNVHDLDNIMVHEVDNIMADEDDNIMADENDDNEFPQPHVISPGR